MDAKTEKKCPECKKPALRKDGFCSARCKRKEWARNQKYWDARVAARFINDN